MRGVNHGVRIAVIWLLASIVVELLIAVIPIPSPAQSTQGAGAHQTIYMLFYVGAPVFVFVLTLFLYNVIVFRRRGLSDEDLPERPDSTPILLLWAGLSFVIVVFLAGWGSFTLKEITTANGPHPLTVQVIGQQWYWTYRYPSYGGMETSELVLPARTPVRFKITSLDVVHSFWIYNYDVKEDAVPGVSNTAYFYGKATGASTPQGKNWVLCNELCGLFHGYMHSKLRVVPKAQFTSWAKRQEAYEASTGLLKQLPKYADVYYPDSPDGAWPPAPQDQSP